MADVTRNIGLSLGADLCWPACYEEIIDRLDLALPLGEDTVRFATERVTIEPYSLRQPCNYDLVVDRLTHWFHTSREWIKKAVIMDGLYVLTNPWAIQSMEKHTSYAAMMKLGFPIPETWMVPPREQTSHEDADITVKRYGRLFDLDKIARELEYPLFIKPYDGGGWRGVSRVKNRDALMRAYDQSGDQVMHMQQSIEGYDLFVRAIGMGPQVWVVRYDPTAPLHARYVVDFNFLDGDEWALMQDMTLTINSFFGWEFNSCEALRRDGQFYPIDFANACPDVQVTSLHYHFPEMVKRLLRWTLFCAYTRREMKPNLDWQPFFDVAKLDLSFRERLARYADIAHERMETERFTEFCDTHLSHLDEVVWEYFGTSHAKAAIRAKVEALYPPHEIEMFTEHFWGLVQFWRKTEGDRMGTNRGEQTRPSSEQE
jgi:hypothetical protein